MASFTVVNQKIKSVGEDLLYTPIIYLQAEKTNIIDLNKLFFFFVFRDIKSFKFYVAEFTFARWYRCANVTI